MHAGNSTFSTSTNGGDCDYTDGQSQFFSTNLFDYNQYHVGDVSGSYFRWAAEPYPQYASIVDFPTFQSMGHEEHGTIDTDIPAEPALPSSECAATRASPRRIAATPRQYETPKLSAVYDKASRRLSVVFSGKPDDACSPALFDALGRRVRTTESFAGNHNLMQ